MSFLHIKNIVEVALFCVFSVPLSVRDFKTLTVFRPAVYAGVAAILTWRSAAALLSVKIAATTFPPPVDAYALPASDFLGYVFFTAVGAGFMLAVYKITRGGIGRGDIFFGALCGAFTGRKIFLAFLMSCVLAAVFIFVRCAVDCLRQRHSPRCRTLLAQSASERERSPKARFAKASCSEKIPFVPFLTLGALVAYFFSSL